MGVWFEDVAAELHEEKQRPAIAARERFARTSAPIWEALQSPDPTLARSTPDYDEDFTSPGEGARSAIGPEYWDEKKEYERAARAERALGIIDGCRSDSQALAAQACSGKGGGPRTLPTGALDNDGSEEDCLRMWADGMPARTTTDERGRGTSESSGWEVHGGVSGEVGGTNRKVGGELGGSYNSSSGSSESSSHGESLSFPGADGYTVTCGRKGMQWFDEDVNRALAHWTE